MRLCDQIMHRFDMNVNNYKNAATKILLNKKRVILRMYNLVQFIVESWKFQGFQSRVKPRSWIFSNDR